MMLHWGEAREVPCVNARLRPSITQDSATERSIVENAMLDYASRFSDISKSAFDCWPMSRCWCKPVMQSVLMDVIM
jgi:hypothetical protein